MQQSIKKIQRPVLSISLLSSGRKDTIWKCLDSLKMIMEQIPSELVIVDTGCDEETHEKMKEYTNHIIDFNWCNDFSKARNAGLKECSGEWFLYIDDDEWFEDIEKLVEFFKNGEYKNYMCASYIQRNYLDYQGKHYRDAWVSRMIRLDEDTRFESSIHEYLFPVKGKGKRIHSAVKHFGYIFDSVEKKYAHSKRNIVLLLDMIHKERQNIRWWMQLAQEYRGIRELYKLEETCLEGLSVFKDINENNTNRQRGTLYVGVLLAQMYRQNYNDAICLFKEAVKDSRNTQLCNTRLYALGAEAYYKLKKYEECIFCCEEYIKSYKKFAKDEEQCYIQNAFFVDEVFEQEIRNNVFCFYMGSGIKNGNIKIMYDYFWELEWDAPEFSFYTGLVPDVIEGMISATYNDKLVQIAETMMKRKGIDEKVVNEIKKYEKEDFEKFIILCNIFSKIESVHYYILYMKILQMGLGDDVEKDREKLEQYYDELFGKVVNIFSLSDYIYEIADEQKLDLESLFLKVNFDEWKIGVEYYCKQASQETLLKRQKLILDCCQKRDIRFEYFHMKTAETLVKLCKDESYDKIKELLIDYAEKSNCFYQKFYKEEVFKGAMEMLPQSCRLAVKLQKLFELEVAEDIKEVLEYIKECLKVYPPMDSVIQSYSKLCVAEFEEQQKQREEAKNEMEKLAIQIKEKVRFFIDKGMHKEALDVVKQVRLLFPEDEELEGLEVQIQNNNEGKIV